MRLNHQKKACENVGLRMIGVMLDNNYASKLRNILQHHKRTCRGQVMAWIDEETHIIAKESQG